MGGQTDTAMVEHLKQGTRTGVLLVISIAHINGCA
jgi:hypothetical protein